MKNFIFCAVTEVKLELLTDADRLLWLISVGFLRFQSLLRFMAN